MPAFDDVTYDVQLSTMSHTYGHLELHTIREKGIHQQRRLEVLGEWCYIAIITDIAYRQWSQLTSNQLDEVRRRLAKSAMILDMSLEFGLHKPVMPIPDNDIDRPTPVECFYAHVGYQVDMRGLSEVSRWVQRKLGGRIKKTVEEVMSDDSLGVKSSPTSSLTTSSTSGIKRPLTPRVEAPSKKQCLNPIQVTPYQPKSKGDLENLLHKHGKQVEWTTEMLGLSGPWRACCYVDGKLASIGQAQKKNDAVREAVANAFVIPLKAEPVRSAGRALQGIQHDTLQRPELSLMDRFKEWMISAGKAVSITYTERIHNGTSIWTVECLVDGILVGHAKEHGSLAAAMKEAAMTATNLVTRLKVSERMKVGLASGCTN